MGKGWVAIVLIGAVALGAVLAACGAGRSAVAVHPPTPTSTCVTGTGTPPVPMTVTRDGSGWSTTVAVCIEGHGPFRFLLDTGAGSSLVDGQLAGQLHLPVVGPTAQPVDVGCTTTSRQVYLGDWSVGGVPLVPQPVSTADVPGFGGPHEPVGVLGGDVLSRFGAVRIDFRSDRLTVLAPEARAASSASILTGQLSQPPPPLLVHGIPQAEVSLTVLKTGASALVITQTTFGGGPSSPFLVDTGAAVSTITSEAAHTLHLVDTGRSVRAPDVGCGGTAPDVGSGVWALGSVDIPAQPLATATSAAAAANGVTGTVGPDVLSRYGSIVLDYRTALLWLGAG